MALLGWVPGTESQLADPSQPRFIHNTSGRFESRWATVQIQEDSPAIMLKVNKTNATVALFQDQDQQSSLNIDLPLCGAALAPA